MSIHYARKENLDEALRIEKLEPATMTQPTTKQWSVGKLPLVVGVVAVAAGGPQAQALGTLYNTRRQPPEPSTCLGMVLANFLKPVGFRGLS
jgi:hypothetical protein